MGLFYFGTGNNRIFLYSSVLWLLIIGFVATSGFFENTSGMPPRFLIVIIGALFFSIFWFKNISFEKIDPKYLLAIHTLRLPVELVLFQLYLRKQIPILMTFEGWNFDIIIGVSAIIVWVYLHFLNGKISKKLMLFGNVLGLIFLSTIVLIAILSAPLPIQQLAFEQPNIALLKFPFVFLPAIVVPLVYLSHFISISAISKA
ncbi:hypothetical protein EGI22_20800 [Lacihabitans sp. LS3-19]|nr:hypothetical protein [Lacihabitans sp. LS3-19]